MEHRLQPSFWDVFARNLIYRSQEERSEVSASNLYWRYTPRYGPKVVDNAVFLAQLLGYYVSEDARQKRQKYPTKYEPPDPDDIVISHDVAKNIGPTVARWRLKLPYWIGNINSPEELSIQPCRHPGNVYQGTNDSGLRCDQKYTDESSFSCKCALPISERKARAFLRHYRPNHCQQFGSMNGPGFFNLDVVKTLLVHGEMDTVLRICAIPGVDYGAWKTIRQCRCMPYEMGWDRLYKRAMEAYYILNILYCFPDLRKRQYTKKSYGDRQDEQQPENDYRDTKMYQQMLHSCTKSTQSEVSTYPHRLFFGITDDQFGHIFRVRRSTEYPALSGSVGPSSLSERDGPRICSEIKMKHDQHPKTQMVDDYKFPFGSVPFEVFLNCDQQAPYLLHASEILEVSSILRSFGLPQELVYIILNFASNDDSPRQMLIPHDPLHPENLNILDTYLRDCWDIMVRCSMFAEELGTPIDWRREMPNFARELTTHLDGTKLF